MRAGQAVAVWVALSGTIASAQTGRDEMSCVHTMTADGRMQETCRPKEGLPPPPLSPTLPATSTEVRPTQAPAPEGPALTPRVGVAATLYFSTGRSDTVGVRGGLRYRLHGVDKPYGLSLAALLGYKSVRNPARDEGIGGPTFDLRLEGIVAKPSTVLLPFTYGYLVAGATYLAGLAESGTALRVGVGAGLNLLALAWTPGEEQAPSEPPSTDAHEFSPVYLLLGVLMPNIELYLERVEVGPSSADRVIVTIGVGL